MKYSFHILFLLFLFPCIRSQQDFLPVTDNLVIEGIPPLPMTYLNDVNIYTESRSASLVDWNPVKKEMLITIRFANSNQLLYIDERDPAMAGFRKKNNVDFQFYSTIEFIKQFLLN
jgi:hypothetical protein